MSVPTVSVLTARAKEFLFALKLKPSDKLCSAFQKVGRENGSPDWGIGDVYYGSVVEWFATMIRFIFILHITFYLTTLF